MGLGWYMNQGTVIDVTRNNTNQRKFSQGFNFRFFAVDNLSKFKCCCFKRPFLYFAMSSAQINDFQKSNFAHILFCGFDYVEPGH